MMPARRPRGSDAAGRPSPRTSPALGTSRGSFLARIFVFLAFFVEGAVAPVADNCDHYTSIGCCECLCDGSSVDPPEYVSGLLSTASAAESWCNTDGYGYGVSVCSEMDDFSQEFRNKCSIHQSSTSTRWVPASSSCSTSQYLKDGSCVACPSSTSSDPMDPTSPPSSTSAGGDATYCTCPDDYYGYVDAISGQWVCGFCGASSEKFGSIVPTATGAHDTCTCKAGHYLVSVPPMCTACPSDQTSAGGSLGECTPYHSASCSATAPRATGGTVTAVGDYTIHTRSHPEARSPSSTPCSHGLTCWSLGAAVRVI